MPTMDAREKADVLKYWGEILARPTQAAKLYELKRWTVEKIREIKRIDSQGLYRGRYEKSAIDKLVQGLMTIFCTYGYLTRPPVGPKAYELVKTYGVEPIAEVFAPHIWKEALRLADLPDPEPEPEVVEEVVEEVEDDSL